MMGELPGASAAFLAGLLSFLSPCVLPLIPVYVSIISGESAGSLTGGRSGKGLILLKSVAFVLGFSIVFIALALIFGGGMRLLGSGARRYLTLGSGILVILLALHTAFDIIPFLRFEKRVTSSGSSPTGDGFMRPILFGMAFAAGWTPCVGPILSSILLFSGQSGSLARSGFLLASYSFGLGLPFILSGMFLDRAKPLLAFFKRRAMLIRILSAALLCLFGIAILTGGISSLSSIFIKAGYSLETLAPSLPQWAQGLALLVAKWLTFQGI